MQSIIEIIGVFVAYMILIIMLTSFMIKPIVRNKDIFERFVLYIIVGNFYIINIVFLLAYLNIFNRLSLIITLLLTTVIIRIALNKEDAKKTYLESKNTIRHLLNGEYGKKIFFQNKILRIKYFCIELFKDRKLEWFIFLLIIGYNIYQYSYNSVKFVSFGAPDEEVHLYWIQSLIGGNIFPSGVYPHGFHNVLSAITVIFGFKAVTIINNFATVSIILIMTMLYFGLRKMLTSKYAALLGIMVYSLINIYMTSSIYRFQFSIPQEYGMIMLMPMAIFLFNYLRNKKISDLVFFGMCFSMTISIHFYTAIIALVLCIAIGLVYLYRIIKNKLLLKLILCGILSTSLAVAPLGVGVVLGHELEQSMDWAIRVIQGKEYEDMETDVVDENEDDNHQNINDQQNNNDSFNWNDFLIDAEDEIISYVFFDINTMYIFLSLIALTIISNILFMILRYKKEENLYQLSLGIYGLLLIFLMLCRVLKIPTVMEPKRVAIFFAYLSPFFIAMPFEVIYMIFKKDKTKKICSMLTLMMIPIFAFIIVKFGYLRPLPYFYYFQPKGAMLVDCDIMDKYDDFKWTIVSPVNDISVILNNGYHYELSDFIVEQENWNENLEIRIPTKYVFVYVEKSFITDNREKGTVNSFNVSYEDAQKPLERGLIDNEYYKEYRNILMSKAYYWAKEYIKYFPKEMSVYYEDDEIIIYRIVQNEYGVNNFAINYKANEYR